jgi:protein SPT2
MQEKRKVDALRENRDYSSLFSDDADNAQPTKEQPDNRTLLLVPKSGRDTTYLLNKS